jgi:hypothetical protein
VNVVVPLEAEMEISVKRNIWPKESHSDRVPVGVAYDGVGTSITRPYGPAAGSRLDTGAQTHDVYPFANLAPRRKEIF